MANATNTSANRYKGNDIDTDGDGRVGKADHASNASNVQSSYKGNDIDTDGDGQVDAADHADTAGDANTVDGQHAADLGVQSATYTYWGAAGASALVRWDRQSGTTTRLADPPNYAANIDTGEDGYIYAGPSNTDQVYTYDIAADSWSSHTILPFSSEWSVTRDPL